ncbi:hypothetical protein RN001_000478 [Aquatica leii]|uniref:Peptidase A1 domain-containing protein n=1 Tax=Aquatica leii TaxID=1421715 RepID=A0AAN7SJ62_9COLE|nr:hypothetical protein RN001_000478 [Aquatica leii]
MWKLLLFYCLFVICVLHASKQKHLRIPLSRQKTIREQISFMPNLKRHGIDFEWLTKPHKHNSTNDSIALFRWLDSEFYGVVQIGQKAQTFNMVFDTSWQTSWVISAECGWTSIGCLSHNKYDHTKSFTYKPNGKKFISDQGTYNLTGYFSNDTFLLGHTRVDGQLFVEMTSIPSSHVLSKADGVIGLGFKVGQYDPLFYSMLKNKSIEKPLFSVFLNRDRQSTRGGNVLLGLIDEKHIHQKVVPGLNHTVPEDITYLPVDSKEGYWSFKMDGVAVELTAKNQSIPFCTAGCKAIVDTSTTVIMAPPEDVKSINKLIGATSLVFGRYHVNCDTLNKLPPIDFILGGINFTLHGEHYTQRISFGPITYCVSAFVKSDVASEQSIWILGGAFLSHFYSIYDIEHQQIGFVTAA